MDNCIFCKIINKDLPSKIIYEDNDFICFHDIAPQSKIHALVVPKQHIEDISKVSDKNLYIKLFKTIDKVVNTLKLDHYRIVTNKGANAGQSVFHLHFHIVSDNKLNPKFA